MAHDRADDRLSSLPLQAAGNRSRPISAAGPLGAALFLQALWLLWRSHADLAVSFSPGLQDRKDHRARDHRSPRACPPPDGRRPPAMGRGSAPPSPELDRRPRLPGGVHSSLRREDAAGGAADR